MSELAIVFAILSGVFIYDRYHCKPAAALFASMIAAAFMCAAIACGIIGAYP